MKHMVKKPTLDKSRPMYGSKRSLSWAAVILGVSALMSVGCEQEVSQRPALKGESSVSAALAKAKKEDKLALVVFSAEWCGPCGSLKKALTSQALQPSMEKVVYASVDIDQAKSKPDLDKHHTSSGVPYILVLRPDGSRVAEQEGYDTPSQFAAFLEEALKKA
jgi:thioredoxin 1